VPHWIQEVELKMSQLFVIRTDASQQIGSGHVVRCLTLAEALRDSGMTIEFITRDHPGNLNEYIMGKGFKVHLLSDRNISKSQESLARYEQWLGVTQAVDAAQTIEALVDKDPDWMIIDHYALDHEWEKRLRPHTGKIMVIDDLANRNHDCDLLLDQNYIHDQSRYDELLYPDTLRLLGPTYALLRKDFTANRNDVVKSQHKTNRIFVFFGGSDPDNLTLTAIKALKRPNLKHLSVDVVVGSANPHIVEIKKQVAEHPHAQLHIQIENIAELMTKADIALGAGGSTTWERMALGLPTIIVTIAENQIAPSRDLDQDGYLQWLGNADQVDEHSISDALSRAIESPHQLQEWAQKGRQLVDGAGVQIVSRLLTIGPDVETLSVREARSSDCLLYWRWVNDPVVRENAFNQQAIKLKDHQVWFENQLDNADTIMLLTECKFGPIGQVRFDYFVEHIMIDYSISKQFRGLGLGKTMLENSINYLRQSRPFMLIGEVKGSNKASRVIFQQLGFKQSKSSSSKNVYRFSLFCNKNTYFDDFMQNEINSVEVIREEK
jgi:UDP-2,4-diacetamido-2,4,6-trideoxy-beta-L-altropyranose hydrolase